MSYEPTPDAEPLFRPLSVGALELPHRVVMAPMTRNRAGEGAAPTEMNVTYYRQRASAALVLTEATPVDPTGFSYPHIPGIWSEEQVEGWSKVAGAVHDEGGRIFLQLWHPGRISHSSVQPGGVRPMAPSAVKPDGSILTVHGEKDFETPRALETDEIREVVRWYGRGALRAKEAGFDGVELHGANGYLVDQFLRDGTNRRRDRYGGSPESRVRFLREVTEALMEVWGPDRVGVRISPVNPFNDMEDSDPAVTFAAAARAMHELGIAYLHVVEHAGAKPPTEDEHAEVFRAVRDAFPGVLMVNDSYGREEAIRVVREGYADLVSFAKDFLATPDLPRRLAEDLPLNEPDPDTFYGGDEEGYVDYPVWEAAEEGDLKGEG